jgi:hypothetical protein
MRFGEIPYTCKPAMLHGGPNIIEVTKLKDTPVQCNAAILLTMFILKGYKPQPSNFNIEQIYP